MFEPPYLEVFAHLIQLKTHKMMVMVVIATHQHIYCDDDDGSRFGLMRTIFKSLFIIIVQTVSISGDTVNGLNVTNSLFVPSFVNADNLNRSCS